MASKAVAVPTSFVPTPVDDIAGIVRSARLVYDTGVTKSAAWRKHQLAQLIRMFDEQKPSIMAALASDLKQTEFTAQIAEFEGVLQDAKFALHHLDEWMAPESKAIPLPLQPGKGYVQHEPLGVVLVIGPWNYPWRTLYMPVVGAIAAGNSVIIKPSELTPASCGLMATIVPRYLDPKAIQLVMGGPAETTQLLKQKFDHIFYTGNGRVGRIIMKAAAEHLTPVTLELGGKSPVIVDKTADLDVASRRIVAGKFLNMGQTCVAPDYILVDKAIETALLTKLKSTVENFYGPANKHQANKDLSRIVNTAHTERLSGIISGHAAGDIVIGGNVDVKDKWVAPTIIKNVKADSAAMRDEIFGPILPVLSVNSIDEAVTFINARDKPLALYVFAGDSSVVDKVLRQTSSGGVSVNDTVMQTACPDLPFGGVGASGMGVYNAKASFETFSHRKSILQKGTFIDPALRYPPYDGTNKLKVVTTVNSLSLPKDFFLPSLRQMTAIAAGATLYALRSRL